MLAAAGVGCGPKAAAVKAPSASAGSSLLRPVSPHKDSPVHRTDPAWAALRLPRVPQGPLSGYLLIADRNNDRLLLVSPSKQIVWRFDGLRGPDDAFFSPDWHSIVTNEEFDDTLRAVSLRPSRILWTYGHAAVAGASPGYLNTPDDAYDLPNGDITVADIRNCRIVELSRRRTVARVLGGSCSHDPPRGFASPNGDTPLPDGGLLVTEIGGWIDRLDRSGRLVWSVRSPVAYPSDAQLLPNGEILVASFTSPGRIVELTRFGRVTWSFGAPSGPDRLDQPSLAVRLPNGMIAANDDYNDRVIVIDPKTKAIVWQYGHTGVISSANGYLSKPDGIDFLPAAVDAAAVHVLAPLPATVRTTVRQVGALPFPTSRLAVVALTGGRVLVMGGLIGSSSSNEMLAGRPAHLRPFGTLPIPTHDDAAVRLGETTYLLGGGQATSSDAVVRISPAGHAKTIGSLGEPLSDLGAAVVGETAYIVGGYTGARYASAILAFRGRGTPRLVARLPSGLRYAGVAALGGRLYIAGGITTTGTSDAVFAFDPATGLVTRVATLPMPVAHAPLVALGSSLYLIGGDGSSSILRIQPHRTVQVVGHVPHALTSAAAVTVGSKIYAFGGDGTAAILQISVVRSAR
jgi:outer membrane protein assembly factor BamB